MTAQGRGLILICDDEDSTSRSWEKQLKELPHVDAAFDVTALQPDALTEAIDALEGRQLAAREPGDEPPAGGSGGGEPETELDRADILILDFDLLTLRSDNASASETGERIAYLARAYSNCRYIVALNQFNRGGNTVFDLTLKGHPSSFADLNISSAQVANPGLWTDTREGFRPWTWPCLNDAAKLMETRIEFVLEHFEEPILGALGLDGQRTLAHFTREQLRFLGNSNDPETTTFATFVGASQGGLRGKDEQPVKARMARIAAARVHKWLERTVLPGQNILVDAPHLVARFPSLLNDASEEVDIWQQTALMAVHTGSVPYSVPETSRPFDHRLWLSRPSWLWADLQGNPDIAEVADPFTARFDALRFAEDVSLFYPADQVRGFTPGFDSPWLTRYVVDQDRISADDPILDGPHGIRQVDYQPGVHFAL